MATFSAAVAGSTGLVGSHILSQLLANPAASSVVSITRRPPNVEEAHKSKLNAVVESDSTLWPSKFTDACKAGSVSMFLSGLGTTKKDAGGLENQRKIDYQLNFDLAKAAKDAGVKTYVLISSTGADSKSWFPYTQMKGQLEDDVIALGFERTVISRPGLIVGDRESKRLGEEQIQWIAKFAGRYLGSWAKDPWAQDASTIARAAIAAGLAEGEDWKGNDKGVWVLSQADIVRLGKVEEK